MKRGKPLRRKTALARPTEPLRRSAGLKQGKGLKSAPKAQRGSMRPETRVAALKRDGRCRCGCGQRASQVHHIFKRERWPQLADEIDNLISVAPRCHARHETAFERFARDVVEEQAERVIAKVKRDGDGYAPSMRSYLKRTYRR